jgi:hypothetical protein
MGQAFNGCKKFAWVCLAALWGCGQSDYSTNNLGDFLYDHEREIVSHIQAHFDTSTYEQLIHIDFRPNDFGYLASAENRQDFTIHGPGYEIQAVGPFARVQLPEAAAALDLKTRFLDERIIASLQFRHSSQEKAVEAFKYLFGCEGGRSFRHKLEKTFILGSAGSHGVEALETFSRALKRVCGRQIDYAILGDAISKPGPFPKTLFRAVEENGGCIHFYQRQDLLAGAPIEQCINIKVESETTHASSAELGRSVSEFLLSRLEIRKNQWSLRDLSQVGSFELISYAHSFDGYLLRWFQEDPNAVWRVIVKERGIAPKPIFDLLKTEWDRNSYSVRLGLSRLSDDQLAVVARGLKSVSPELWPRMKLFLENHHKEGVRQMARVVEALPPRHLALQLGRVR